MIGIGVGIDYALFISTRYREALHEGVRSAPGGRPRDRHERPGRAVRGWHRRDLAARPVRDRRVVHPRPRGRRVARRAVRDGGRGHAAAGRARVRRPHDRQVRAAGARRSASTRSTPSGRAGAARCSAGRGRHSSVASSILLVLAIPFLSLRLGVADAGQRPDEVHDPTGVRPAQPKASVRASTARCSSRAMRRRRPSARPPNKLRGCRSQQDPDVAARARCIASPTTRA